MQEVMAAITTSPWPMSKASPATATRAASAVLPKSPTRASSNLAAASDSSTRSCGRLGPARDGRTPETSNSRLSVNTGSGVESSYHRPCSLA